MKTNSQYKTEKIKNIFNIKTNKPNCLKYNYHNIFNHSKKGEIKSINNYGSEKIIAKKIKTDNNSNNDKTNSFNFNNKINYLSQGNSASLEFAKSKNKNTHNINNNHEIKELIIMNKYSPGYIYYKAYKNIIEKLYKKKIQSGKIVFRKNNDKKILNNKKRYKSGIVNKINNPNIFYKTNYILKNIKYKSIEKVNSNDINYNQIFSKTYKPSYDNKNIYSSLNNKKNPYSIHWANKLLNKNDVYIGVNYNTNSSVPILKSLDMKKISNKKCPPLNKSKENKSKNQDTSIKKIKTNKLNINKIKIKCNNEEQKNENINKSYKKEKIINELKEISVNFESINITEDNKKLNNKKIENQEIINNNKNNKDLRQEENNKEQTNTINGKKTMIIYKKMKKKKMNLIKIHKKI